MRFGRRSSDDGFPKTDAGRGSLGDYRFDLRPARASVTLRLAGSDPHQDDLEAAAAAESVTAVVPARTAEEERTDAPMAVRLFADGRVLGPVGLVPRGLEGAVSEAITRLEAAGQKPRIPVGIVSTRHGYRVDLLMGRTL